MKTEQRKRTFESRRLAVIASDSTDLEEKV